MDFKGTVRIDAKLSEMTTGMKSMFLKVIEPVFRRQGATVIPITIGGTVKEPEGRARRGTRLHTQVRVMSGSPDSGGIDAGPAAQTP